MDKKRDSFFLPNKNGKQKKDDRQNQKIKRQDEFQKNREIDEAITKKEKSREEKKPFDKKTYRLKKYSKKYKLEQWEEQRKKKLLRNYYKDIKNETPGSYKPKSFDEDTVDSGQEVGRFVRHPDLLDKENKLEKRKDPFERAKEQYSKIQQEKLEKKQEKEKANEERKQKLQEYKKKKQDRFKKLSKKTKKGQPVMTGRLELLLEKIQKG